LDRWITSNIPELGPRKRQIHEQSEPEVWLHFFHNRLVHFFMFELRMQTVFWRLEVSFALHQLSEKVVLLFYFSVDCV
jgi:hypothetical protein